jgi:hypothetical protein
MPAGDPELDLHDDFDLSVDAQDIDLSIASKDEVEIEIAEEFLPKRVVDVCHKKSGAKSYLVE